MPVKFQADCLPILIGSLPLGDHNEALKMILDHTPGVPLWAQLPIYKEEGMIAQFIAGMPGLTLQNEKVYVDTGDATFETQMLAFYEEYLAITEGGQDLEQSRFVLNPNTARGFFTLNDYLKQTEKKPIAIKGQITGPITFGLGVKNQNGRAIYYDDQLRDVAVKLIALKARWQIEQFSHSGCPVIMFLDEPVLAGFGSSEMISISVDEIKDSLNEVSEAIQSVGGIAGIHVCANTDWDLVLSSRIDLVNFDAYGFFDRFILYGDQIKAFIERGGILAWGIIPTAEPEDIEKETLETLIIRFEELLQQVEALGVERQIIYRQSLISPSCGTGSLSLKHAQKVLQLTRDLSDHFRSTMTTS
jgi:hypothetical protein